MIAANSGKLCNVRAAIYAGWALIALALVTGCERAGPQSRPSSTDLIGHWVETETGRSTIDLCADGSMIATSIPYAAGEFRERTAMASRVSGTWQIDLCGDRWSISLITGAFSSHREPLTYVAGALRVVNITPPYLLEYGWGDPDSAQTLQFARKNTNCIPRQPSTQTENGISQTKPETGTSYIKP